MRASEILAGGVVVIGALVVVAWVAVTYIQRPFRPCSDDPKTPACKCMTVFPSEAANGAQFSTSDGKNVKVQLGASSTSGTKDMSPTQLGAYSACLTAEGGSLEASTGENIGSDFLGRVADLWKDRPLTVSLRPPLGKDGKVDQHLNQILNNLSVGPAVGLRPKIIDEWCREQINKCVKCTPEDITDETNEVDIEIRSDPPVTEKLHSGGWTYNPVKNQIWEMIDSDGYRHMFECKK